MQNTYQSVCEMRSLIS